MAWKVIDLQWYLRQELEDTAVLFCSTVAWRKPLLKQKHWLFLWCGLFWCTQQGRSLLYFYRIVCYFYKSSLDIAQSRKLCSELGNGCRKGGQDAPCFWLPPTSLSFCIGLGLTCFIFSQRKAVLRSSQAGLGNLLRFSYMVYNGTIGGINALVITSRDNARIILGGRIREGRQKDFPNTL